MKRLYIFTKVPDMKTVLIFYDFSEDLRPSFPGSVQPSVGFLKQRGTVRFKPNPSQADAVSKTMQRNCSSIVVSLPMETQAMMQTKKYKRIKKMCSVSYSE